MAKNEGDPTLRTTNRVKIGAAIAFGLGTALSVGGGMFQVHRQNNEADSLARKAESFPALSSQRQGLLDESDAIRTDGKTLAVIVPLGALIAIGGGAVFGIADVEGNEAKRRSSLRSPQLRIVK